MKLLQDLAPVEVAFHLQAWDARNYAVDLRTETLDVRELLAAMTVPDRFAAMDTGDYGEMLFYAARDAGLLEHAGPFHVTLPYESLEGIGDLGLDDNFELADRDSWDVRLTELFDAMRHTPVDYRPLLRDVRLAVPVGDLNVSQDASVLPPWPVSVPEPERFRFKSDDYGLLEMYVQIDGWSFFTNWAEPAGGDEVYVAVPEGAKVTIGASDLAQVTAWLRAAHARASEAAAAVRDAAWLAASAQIALAIKA